MLNNGSGGLSESRNDILGGRECFKGTRIPVAYVKALILRHVPREELRVHFPTLTEEQLDLAFKLASDQ